MRLFLLHFLAFSVVPVWGADIPARDLWASLEARRERLASFHQEFEVSQTTKTVSNSQSSHRKITLDLANGQWRERSTSGSGSIVRIFDGKDLSRMEEGGDEYIRTKRKSNDVHTLPPPYSPNADWSKAKEVERRPCGFPTSDHQCVLLQAPLNREQEAVSPANIVKVLEGSERVLLDTETGLIVSSRTVRLIQNQRGSYQSDLSYVLSRMNYGSAPDASLFTLPRPDMSEVKQLTRWNAARIKKQLVGQPAPELTVTGLRGEKLTLSALKGKTVLLDFWTTWCPPCRADAPSLDRLYRRYGDKDLMIVGISVSEERAVVERFLRAHPHSFPVVLTTENEMPRPYEIGVFPTYIVIGPNGTVSAAAEGDQGFGELRHLLKKAGLEIE